MIALDISVVDVGRLRLLVLALLEEGGLDHDHREEMQRLSQELNLAYHQILGKEIPDDN